MAGALQGVNNLARAAVLLAIAMRGLDAQSVSVSAGNIVYHTGGGSAHKISNGGLDSMPAISPDGRWVVFVRQTPGDTVNTSLGWEQRTELWIVRSDGSNAKRLLRGREGTSPETSLARLENPAFSVDGRTVYFGSTGWVTSDALHAVDVATGRERFVCAANGFELLTRGQYRGDIMVGQHRYKAEGSYDGTWIVSPRGSVIRLVTLEDAPDADAWIAAARAGKGP